MCLIAEMSLAAALMVSRGAGESPNRVAALKRLRWRFEPHALAGSDDQLLTQD